jgi:soluble lytic murein transglycosylase
MSGLKTRDVYSLISGLLTFVCTGLVLFSLFLCSRYPRAYRAEIAAAANEFNVDGDLVAAVIFCESRYKKDAVSGAGAVGLMQLMPSTAEFCAKKTGIDYDAGGLTEPGYNIRLGAFYLSYLLGRFNNSETDALAAYNAGEGTVRMWKQKGLDEIPYKETGDYLKRVAAAKRVYGYFHK